MFSFLRDRTSRLGQLPRDMAVAMLVPMLTQVRQVDLNSNGVVSLVSREYFVCVDKWQISVYSLDGQHNKVFIQKVPSIGMVAIEVVGNATYAVLLTVNQYKSMHMYRLSTLTTGVDDSVCMIETRNETRTISIDMLNRKVICVEYCRRTNTYAVTALLKADTPLHTICTHGFAAMKVAGHYDDVVIIASYHLTCTLVEYYRVTDDGSTLIKSVRMRQDVDYTLFVHEQQFATYIRENVLYKLDLRTMDEYVVYSAPQLELLGVDLHGRVHAQDLAGTIHTII